MRTDFLLKNVMFALVQASANGILLDIKLFLFYALFQDKQGHSGQ